MKVRRFTTPLTTQTTYNRAGCPTTHEGRQRLYCDRSSDDDRTSIPSNSQSRTDRVALRWSTSTTMDSRSCCNCWNGTKAMLIPHQFVWSRSTDWLQRWHVQTSGHQRLVSGVAYIRSSIRGMRFELGATNCSRSGGWWFVGEWYIQGIQTRRWSGFKRQLSPRWPSYVNIPPGLAAASYLIAPRGVRQTATCLLTGTNNAVDRCALIDSKYQGIS